MPNLRSANVDIDGSPVHLADYGGNPEGPTVVCVHGLAGSHAHWRGLAAALSTHCRVLAVDLPGHGRTPRLGRSASISANRAVLNRLLKDVIGEPVVLVGHSMGASLSILQAALEPQTVSAMTLIAPPMPRAAAELPSRLLASQIALCAWPWLAQRTLSRRLQRLGADGFVQANLARTCVSPDAVDPLTRGLVVELIESRAAGEDAHAAFVEAARSVGLFVARTATYREILAAVTCPTLLLHGDSDRLLRHSALERLTALQPDWRVEVLGGLGHSPHMEGPQVTAELVLEHVTESTTRFGSRPVGAPIQGYVEPVRGAASGSELLVRDAAPPAARASRRDGLTVQPHGAGTRSGPRQHGVPSPVAHRAGARGDRVSRERLSARPHTG